MGDAVVCAYMGENWVNIAIPESVQEQAQKSDKPYHRLITEGLAYNDLRDDELQAIEIMRKRLDEWEREARGGVNDRR